MSIELRIAIVFSVTMIVAAICMWFAPLLSRRGIFFGLTVTPGFRQTEDAKQIVSGYRRLIAAGTVICTAALWLAVPHLDGLYWPLAFVSTAFIQFFVGVGAFIAANKRVQVFAKPQPRSRTVSIEPRKRNLPGGWTLLLGPLLIVAFAGFSLFARRDAMPAGTFPGALSTLLAPFCVNVVVIWIAYLAIFRTRQINAAGPAALEESRSRRIGYLSLLVFAYLGSIFGVVLAFAAVKVVTGVRAGGSIFAVLVVVWTVAFIVELVLMRHRILQRTFAVESPDGTFGDSTPDECWKWGIIYYNSDDPAFLVEKRVGFGWTLNYGNKWSWVLSIGLLAAPFVIRFFWFR